MGLFDWLKGSKRKVEVAGYRIWLTHAAKIAGIRKEAAAAIADPAGPNAVIAVAHFDDCLQQLAAAAAGLDPNRIRVTRSDCLPSRPPTDLIADESSLLILVGERHPLASHDDDVLEFAQSQPCRCRVVYHVSLEDPLLKPFAGEWVENILRRLGMKEDEAIESTMVSRRIQRELNRIAKTATGDAPANSAAEWLERNCASK